MQSRDHNLGAKLPPLNARLSRLTRASSRLLAINMANSGFSLVEATISAVILAIAVAASIQLFATYTENAANARIRDGLSSLIIKDIENLRFKSKNLWSCSSATYSSTTVCTTAASVGGLSSAYSPPAANCSAGTLATAAGTEDSTFAATTTNLTIDTSTQSALRNPTISRTIVHTGNIIKVSYNVTTPIAISQVAYLLPNAQSWCAS